MKNKLNLEQLNQLYDQLRYVDAYHAAAIPWDDTLPLDQYTIDELIFIMRLANRLGGNKYSRRIIRHAGRRAPDHPVVKYYNRIFHQHSTNLLKEIARIEKNPFLNSGNPVMDSYWLNQNAIVYALIRDFPTARYYFHQAEALNSDDDWIRIFKTDILLMEDRWDEAFEISRPVWDHQPGHPYHVSQLGRIYLRHEKINEWIELLDPVMEVNQSYETVLIYLFYLCCQMERLQDNTKKSLLKSKLTKQVNRLSELILFKEPKIEAVISRMKLDIAIVLNDDTFIHDRDHQLNNPYDQEISRRFRQNGIKSVVTVNYRPVMQKHLTCLPSSIAALLGYYEVNLDIGRIVNQLTFAGTSKWKAISWLEEEGYLTRIFLVTPEISRQIIKAGLPFILLTEDIDNAHATLAVGYHESIDSLIVHDPSFDRLNYILLDKIGLSEYPIGPQGLLVCSQENKSLLNIIPAELSEPMNFCLSFEKIMSLEGPRAGKKIIEKANRLFPDSPIIRRLTAYYLFLTGDIFQSLDILNGLFPQYPNCIQLERDILINLFKSKNVQAIKAHLQSIVEKGRIPGIDKNKDWLYPLPVYTSEYANYLGISQENYQKAEQILNISLSHFPYEATTYHVLGDIYYRQGNEKKSLMPYRIAAHLNIYNEHYAQTLFDLYDKIGRTDDGFAYLKDRIEQFMENENSSQFWITLVDNLKNYGYPQEAIQYLELSEGKYRDDPYLSKFAVQFWITYGKWEKARKSLQRLEKIGQKPLFLEAAVNYYYLSGDWQRAYNYCENWIKYAPDQIESCQKFLTLSAMKYSKQQTLELTRQWIEVFNGNVDFEQLHYQQLYNLFQYQEAEAQIRRYIEHNRDDLWGHQELGHLILSRIKLLPVNDREQKMTEIEAVIETCNKIDCQNSQTILLKAMYAVLKGQLNQARQLYTSVLEQNADYQSCYEWILDLISNEPEEVQLEVINGLETFLFSIKGHLFFAGTLILKIAEITGFESALTRIENWLKKRPYDPELILGQSSLLLNYIKGDSEARTAIGILEKAVAAFPHHFGLKMALANAYEITLNDQQALRQLMEILEWSPLHSQSRINLAHIYNRSGCFTKAVSILEQGIKYNPNDIVVWQELADLYWSNHLAVEAIAILKSGLAKNSENIALRENLIDYSCNLGDFKNAVMTAREGIKIYPDGAYMWCLYANTMNRSEEFRNLEEMEQCYREALKYNIGLFEAAENLAILLTEKQSFTEARQVMEEQKNVQIMNPFVVSGRLAWITRKENKQQDAINEMIEVLKQWPLYSWGWWVLMSWLETDQRWDLAKECLSRIPEALLDAPDLYARRIDLFEKAGMPKAELDAEWESLLKNFPLNLNIHLSRYDLLKEKKEWPHAIKLIKNIAQFFPDASGVLCRMIEVELHEKNDAQAIRLAKVLWQLPGDYEKYPEQLSWDVLTDDYDRIPLLIKEISDLVFQGVKIRTRIFELFIEKINHHPDIEHAMSKRRVYKRLLTKLLYYIRTLNWDTDYWQSIVLEKLAKEEFQDQVYLYYRKFKAAAQSSTQLWQFYGYFLVESGHYRQARHWLSVWRGKKGVQMWCLTNYLICLTRHENRFSINKDIVDEKIAVCEYALQTVPPDHTYRFLLTSYCENLIRQQQDEQFLSVMNQYQHIILNNDKKYFMNNHYVIDKEILLIYEKLLKKIDNIYLKFETRKLITLLNIRNKSWVIRNWLQRIRMNFFTYLILKISHLRVNSEKSSYILFFLFFLFFIVLVRYCIPK